MTHPYIVVHMSHAVKSLSTIQHSSVYVMKYKFKDSYFRASTVFGKSLKLDLFFSPFVTLVNQTFEKDHTESLNFN